MVRAAAKRPMFPTDYPVWDYRTVDASESIGATTNVDLADPPAGAKRVMFSVLSQGGDFISIHTNASASAHEGVMVGGQDGAPRVYFDIEEDNPADFHAYNSSGGALVLGVVYFF